MIIFIIVLAFIFEIIDSGLGMMYGTLLTPILLILGYPVATVIPCILMSQAAGGFIGSLFHNKYGNTNLIGITKDFKIAILVIISGLIAVTLGVTFASYIPETFLKGYIGILAIAMGILCIVKPIFNFNWWKVVIMGFLASFNKSSTGGGFGPLCSTGLILGGLKSKTSIALTTLSEVPLCIISFVMYVYLKGFPDLYFLLILCLGSALGGTLGPRICAKMDLNILQKIVGILAIISGCLITLKLLF